MTIEPAAARDVEELARMPCALWPRLRIGASRREARRILGGCGLGGLPWTFLVARAGGTSVGFVEISVRSAANDCDPSRPVGYLEGWWVAPRWRRRGVGRALVKAAFAWARAQGCREFASDAHARNLPSRAAHRALGFRESVSLVTFRRSIRART